MRLQLFSTGKSAHSGFAACVCWISNDQFVTSGDDKKLLFRNTSSRQHEPIKTIQLSIDAFPVSMDYGLQNAASNSQLSGPDSNQVGQVQSGQMIVIGTSNGKVFLFPLGVSTTQQPPSSQQLGSQQQQQMKKFDAHQGAVIVVRWSPDMSTLATAGEDGLVKIWSKSGMLRSTLTQNEAPIYCLSWAPDSNSLVYGANGGMLVIKSLSPQSRSQEWIAHEGLISSLDWNLHNRSLILSAGEDGRVILWDTNGTLLFSTAPNQSSIPTSVCWSPDGKYFAVSTFLSIKLYHASGTVATVEKLSFEGVFRAKWAPDSNQLAMVCANGTVLIGAILDEQFENGVWQIRNSSRRTIAVRNYLTDVNEVLDFPTPITRFGFAFEHLIVVTASQCLIYKSTNWTAPSYFDIRSLDLVILIVQSAKHFLLIGSNFSANLYEYSGRSLKTFKLNNMKFGALHSQIISLNNHILAYKDAVNQTSINFVSLSGKSRTSLYRHSLEISSLRVSPESKDSEQIAVFIDANQDLYSLLMRNENIFQIFKLSSMIYDFTWHSEYSVIVALNENQNLTMWLYPNVAYVDANLLNDVQIPLTLDPSQLATPGSNSSSTKSVKFSEFIQDQITLIKADQVRIHVTVNSFVVLLPKLKRENRWNDAVKMCNILDQSSLSQDSTTSSAIDRTMCTALWAALAVMALEAKQFDVSEIAYAAIDKLEKVIHLNAIKSLPQTEVQNLELELMRSNIDGAETGFIQKGYILRAVILNLKLFRWSKALGIAQKFNSKFAPIVVNGRNIPLVELVLSSRQNYLHNKNRPETLEEFENEHKNYDDLVDWKEVEPNLKPLLYSKL